MTGESSDRRSLATIRVLETIFPLTAMPADGSDLTEHDRTEPAASFAALGVPAPLVDVLDHQGITAPFPVQAAVLPDARDDDSVLRPAEASRPVERSVGSVGPRWILGPWADRWPTPTP